MRSKYFRIIIGIFLAMTLNSCDVDDDDGVNSELPEITSIGANTFGCKINEQIFLPRKGSLCFDCANTPKLNLTYGYRYGEGHRLSIYTYNDIDGDVSIKINMFNGEIPFTIGEYSISEYYIDSKDILVHNGITRISKLVSGENINSDFYTDTEVSGVLKILEINEDEEFIAGTFEFEAIDAEGKIVKVTEGRFDIKYKGF